MSQMLTGGAGRSGVEYYRRVLSIQRAALLAYLPLMERSNGTAYDASGNGRSGAYTGVELDGTGPGDGRGAPLWDGANDTCNWYSASLAAAFNGAAGTLAAWARVNAAGVWTDGAIRTIATISVNAGNSVLIRKTATNNQLAFVYVANTTAEQVLDTSLNGSAAWFHVAITWDRGAGANGEVKAYLNGAQVGATQTSLGTWAGVPAASLCNVGAGSTAPAQVWSGRLAHVPLWSVALSSTDIAKLVVLNA